MNVTTRRALPAALTLALLTACSTARKFEQPASPSVPAMAPAPTATGLYGAEEALRDVLSGPLVYVGTGRWPGNARMQACAFRNERVLVVNVYCGITDTQAFRLEVYSPSRGRVRIYAESKAPVSEHTRPQYFSFTAESEPPPGPGTNVPSLQLNMSFQQLSAYDEARYAAYLPACYGGTERQTPRSGCLGPLASEAPAWTQQHRTFLAQASSDWYRIVRELRALAQRHGRDPE